MEAPVKSAIFLTQFFILAINLSPVCLAAELWERVPGLNETDLKDIAIDPYNKGTMYAASEKTLYKSQTEKGPWTAVFSVEGENNSINFIGVFESGVFVCTKNGVFKSADEAANWKRVYKGVGAKENNAQHVAFLKDKGIFLGTQAGLFKSQDGGINWEKYQDEAGGFNIRWIEFLDGDIFLATEKGVYSDSGSGWKKIFSVTAQEGEFDPDAADELVQALKPVNSILVRGSDILLATDSGIFISQDKGGTWKRFDHEGLLSLRVKRLLFSEEFYAVTDKGVFIFSEKERLWQSLYSGMNTSKARGIAIDQDGNILAVTKKGLYGIWKNKTYAAGDSGYSQGEKQDILNSFDFEPSIGDIQNAAIQYAEVHPDKIREWRNSANKKALLPNVSVGLDRYVTDLLHWDSGTSPDTFQKGKDTVSWDVTMTWDMGELIWNSDQTSIDTRSKLMVELRDDIMNEVTRTYFERRRLQIEMLTSPPQDLKLSLEKEIRLQELTADIDALTGGYLSKYTEK